MRAIFHYAIKTSLSLNYIFTISLFFLTFKLPHIGQRNYQTCRPASKLVCKVRLTDKILQLSSPLESSRQKHILIAPTAVNNRTSLSLDDFIADTKKYITIIHRSGGG